MLRSAGGVTNLYAGGYEYVYVVGGDGAVTWRNLSGWDDSGVTAAVQDALDDLQATPAPPQVRAVPTLAAPYPNPFNPRTTLEISLPSGDALVNLVVFDQRGRRVRALLDNAVVREPGLGVQWDGLGDDGMPTPSGVYFFRLRAGDATSVTKGVLVR